MRTSLDQEEQAQIRQRLLEYCHLDTCHLDTLAMVKILDKMREMVAT